MSQKQQASSDFPDRTRLLKNERGQSTQLSQVWWHAQVNYELLEICGEGSFGQVVRARHKSNGREVAIKMIGDAFDHQYGARKVLREVHILRALTQAKMNVFTTKLYEILTPGLQVEAIKLKKDDGPSLRNLSPKEILSKRADEYQSLDLSEFGTIFLVLEFIESDLKKILNSVHRGTVLEEDHIVTMMYNSLCALNYVHTSNLLHRDLKPGNLLVDSNCCIRICDFGLARTWPREQYNNPNGLYSIKSQLRHKMITQNSTNETINEYKLQMSQSLKSHFSDKNNQYKKRSLSSRVVSRWYRAPEAILTEKDYDFALDVWSLGCILAETLRCSQLQVDALIAGARKEKQLAEKDVQAVLTQAVKERFYFEGGSCYPISPISAAKGDEANVVSGDDQIIKINEDYGKVNELDVSFISNENIRDYQGKVTSNNPRQFERVVTNEFKACNPLLVKLVLEMLEYNPFFRPSAKESLASSVFDEIRVQALERDATQKIEILSDEVLPIDYTSGRVEGLERSPENSKLVIFFFKIETLREIQLLRGIQS